MKTNPALEFNNEFLFNSMFAQKTLYISTTLPYINSNPHIGHAFEFVLSDFFKRYYNLIKYKINSPYSLGNFDRFDDDEHNCILNTGVDEHGQKVYQSALAKGKDPQEYCDNACLYWEEFCKLIYMSYDIFYRTTSDDHKRFSQEFLFNIRNILYQKEYKGKYCIGCESFKTEKEIKNKRCEFHPSVELQEISENNFFFPLSNFKKIDIENILVDKSLLSELRNIIENCSDLSISRERVSWGIPIPFSNQTIYVWFEALLNYVFATGYNPALLNFSDFSEKWKNSLIICGKDNLKFQAFILPAILKSQGIKPPSKILVHGMILDERGNKMSKSEGNVIDPINQIGKFGIGAFRYYLLSGINTFQNSSYSEEELINKYNNDLSNNLGNLISRVTSIIEKEPEFFHSEIEGHDFLKKPENKMFELIKGIKNKNSSFISYSSAEIKKAHEEIQVNLNVKNAFTILNNLVTQTNKYFTIKKPYDKLLPFEERRNCIVEMLYIIKELYYFYAAATPNIQNQYLSIFRSEKISKTILYKKLEKEPELEEKTFKI